MTRKAGFNPTGTNFVQNPVTGGMPAGIPGGMVPVQMPNGQIVLVPAMGGEGLAFDAPQETAAPNISFGANIDLKFDQETEIDPKWYLKREEDLASVTTDRTNPVIGVSDIKVFKPTANQKHAGIVCKVQLVTPVATFNNISVMGSKFDASAVRLVLPSHEGANGGWFEDYKLDQKVTAQVLSYIDSLITK